MSFGDVVMYLPDSDKITSSKDSPKLRPGVFVICIMKGGARWSGEYLANDLETFVGANLGIDANTANMG